ncbi:thioredoxin family protein [Spirosoma linguale]|uniref:Thioredoxin-like protein n=1 Tax=Spirosoma linguale (strain ATCC 33905 / DSM 74 / LMG 10896 / Claus 1) TaxID=504472 RepID=D2QC40_SPILD|nr:hypothetical protein Slin_3780 [Spirosoma linguale DSM 74]
MIYSDYQQLFDQILSSPPVDDPYTDPTYWQYTKLNQVRMKRWDKQLILPKELAEAIKSLTSPQHWMIITEPWCGDAAHIIPFLIRLAALNELITYAIQLRDRPPFLINSYLTKGSKSIPKLVVRDQNGSDVFCWGPRPKAAQLLVDHLKASGLGQDDLSTALQQWYNQDKGVSMCQELLTYY